MRYQVAAAPRAEIEWIRSRTQCAVTEGFRAIKATDAAGRIVGMVGYDLWTPNAVTAHMAVDTPMAWRALIPAVFEYPFLECNRSMLLAIITSDNKASLRLATKMGFTVTHRTHDGWNKGVDLIFLELHRDDCVYLQTRKAA